MQLGIIDTRYSSEAGDRSEKTIVNTKNTGSYKWTVPSNIGTMDFSNTSDPVYRIKLYVGNQEVNDFDQSDNTFSIIDKRANNVKISLSKDTPKSNNIKLGEQNVDFLKFDIKNSGKEIAFVSGVRLNGSLLSTDLSKISIYDGTTQIGSGTPDMSISGLQLQISFSEYVAIAPDTVKTLTVKGDVSARSEVVGNKVALGVEKINVRIGNGNFEVPVVNVMGKKMTIVSGGSSSDLIGDVDGNGVINCADKEMILKAVANIITLTPDQQKRADVDRNGTVQAYDASLLMQKNNLSCNSTALSTPTNLSATVNGKNVVLSWSAVSGATAYNIYRDLPTVSGTSARYLDWANGITTYTGIA